MQKDERVIQISQLDSKQNQSNIMYSTPSQFIGQYIEYMKQFANIKQKQTGNYDFPQPTDIICEVGVQKSEIWMLNDMVIEIQQITQNNNYLFLYFYYKGFRIPLSISILATQSPVHDIKTIRKGNHGKIYKTIIDNEDTVIKCIQCKQFQRDKFALILRQYSILKIASNFGVGPKTKNNCGFDIIVYQNCVEFCMEYCKDITQYSTKIEKDLMYCLARMHTFRLFHFDIKPQNICYSPSQQRYVFLDFGLSQLIYVQLGRKTLIDFRGSLAFCSQQMQKATTVKQNLIDIFYNDLVGLRQTLEKLKQFKQFDFEPQGKGIFTMVSYGHNKIIQRIMRINTQQYYNPLSLLSSLKDLQYQQIKKIYDFVHTMKFSYQSCNLISTIESIMDDKWNKFGGNLSKRKMDDWNIFRGNMRKRINKQVIFDGKIDNTYKIILQPLCYDESHINYVKNYPIEQKDQRFIQFIYKFSKKIRIDHQLSPIVIQDNDEQIIRMQKEINKIFTINVSPTHLQQYFVSIYKTIYKLCKQHHHSNAFRQQILMNLINSFVILDIITEEQITQEILTYLQQYQTIRLKPQFCLQSYQLDKPMHIIICLIISLEWNKYKLIKVFKASSILQKIYLWINARSNPEIFFLDNQQQFKSLNEYIFRIFLTIQLKQGRQHYHTILGELYIIKYLRQYPPAIQLAIQCILVKLFAQVEDFNEILILYYKEIKGKFQYFLKQNLRKQFPIFKFYYLNTFKYLPSLDTESINKIIQLYHNIFQRFRIYNNFLLGYPIITSNVNVISSLLRKKLNGDDDDMNTKYFILKISIKSSRFYKKIGIEQFKLSRQKFFHQFRQIYRKQYLLKMIHNYSGRNNHSTIYEQAQMYLNIMCTQKFPKELSYSFEQLLQQSIILKDISLQVPTCLKCRVHLFLFYKIIKSLLLFFNKQYNESLQLFIQLICYCMKQHSFYQIATQAIYYYTPFFIELNPISTEYTHFILSLATHNNFINYYIFKQMPTFYKHIFKINIKSYQTFEVDIIMNVLTIIDANNSSQEFYQISQVIMESIYQANYVDWKDQFQLQQMIDFHNRCLGIFWSNINGNHQRTQLNVYIICILASFYKFDRSDNDKLIFHVCKELEFFNIEVRNNFAELIYIMKKQKNERHRNYLMRIIAKYHNNKCLCLEQKHLSNNQTLFIVSIGKKTKRCKIYEKKFYQMLQKKILKYSNNDPYNGIPPYSIKQFTDSYSFQ